MDYNALRGKAPDEIIAAASKDSGIPEAVFRNMWQVESGSGSNMLNEKSGAQGHMQIMDRELGVMRERYGKELDPNELSDSMFMASQMLKENLQHFGNLPDAISAYNGGWKKEKWNNDETRNYTPAVLNGTGIASTDSFTTSRSQMDSERPQASVSGTNKAPKLTDQEKAEIYRQQLAESLSGASDDEAVQVGTQLALDPALAHSETMVAGNQPAAVDYNSADQSIEGSVAGDVKTAARVEARTMNETYDAAMDEFSLTNAIYNTLANFDADRLDAENTPDPVWQADYIENRQKYVAGMSPDAVMRLDASISGAEAASIAEQDKEAQKRQQILNDSEHPIMWGLVGGMLDPAGFAVGAGAGKAFQVGRSASAAAEITKIAASNAVGNVAITGALDTLGKTTTADDYVHAAAFGMLTGAVLGGLPHIWTKADVNEIADTVAATHERGTANTVNDIKSAMTQNPTATPEELAKAAKQTSQQRVEQVISDVQNDPAPASKVFKPERQLDPVEVGDVETRMALDSIEGEEQLMSIGGLYKSAEEFLETNKGVLNEARMLSEKNRAVSDVMGWRSASNELITDDNPLAKVLGMTVGEDAGGTSGYRGTTVAIKSKLLSNEFNHHIERGINENYQGWLAENKVGRIGGALETYTTGKRLQQFYESVYDEVEFRGKPDYSPSASIHVQRAANVMERGYQTMANRQKQAKTLGNEMVPDSSVGYQPHQLDPKAIRQLSANEKRTVMNEFRRQAVQDFGWDTEFADKLVRNYINRAEDYAMGTGGGHTAAPRSLLEVAIEDLNAKNLAPHDYMVQMEKLRKGAARHTGKRLDWDLSQKITLDNGHSVPMSSMYTKDILSLFKGYANRVSGDVAFAHVGILGDRDIRLVTEALQRSKVGNAEKTIPAWQQIVAEVYNRPTAVDSGGPLSTTARFIRQYTGIRLLGGVGFMQLGELSNAVAHVGVSNTLHMASRIPAVWGDIKTLKAGKVPENPILSSLDMVAGSPLGAEQFQMILPQVIDDGLSIVDSRSINNVMRVMGGGQLIHNKFSFMRSVTAVEQRVVAEEIVRKAFRFMKTGQEDAALKQMGFTAELQAKIMAEFDDIAMFNEKGYLQALDVRKMKDKAAMEELLVTVRRGTGQVIQETFPGETGKWMRSEIGQLLMQFRKFPSVAIEKQMNRQFKSIGTARAMGGITAAMALGTILYSGRVGVAASLMDENAREKYLKNRMSVAGMANGALMYVSALGMTSDFMQLGSGVGGLLDDQLDLGWSGSRGAMGQGLGGVIPSLGTLGDAYNLTQNPTTKGALKLLPFTNLPAVLPFMNALKHNED